MKGVGTIEVNKEEIKEGSMFEHAAVDKPTLRHMSVDIGGQSTWAKKVSSLGL